MVCLFLMRWHLWGCSRSATVQTAEKKARGGRQKRYNGVLSSSIRGCLESDTCQGSRRPRLLPPLSRFRDETGIVLLLLPWDCCVPVDRNDFVGVECLSYTAIGGG
ncbi:hypothetical protein LZ31DRAFT_83811 [Colletotrichum somersetense]|nr:hypothetical protein LZ31DRAFT_83811 [Colletotrichum somersetense]